MDQRKPSTWRNKKNQMESRIMELVEVHLKMHPAMRDDDMLLIANIWMTQIGPEKADKMTGRDFLKGFADNHFYNPESIRRMRQKLQEKDPLLRGKRYMKRHERAEHISSIIKNL